MKYIILVILIHYGIKFGSMVFWANDDNIKYNEFFTAVIRNDKVYLQAMCKYDKAERMDAIIKFIVAGSVFVYTLFEYI